jgi:hypothetical protein
MPQAPDQGGIIDALRSRGAAPQAALANIMQPPMQANIGLAAGSGSLAALPGGAGVGANPYLSGVVQQNKDQFYQQLNMQREQRARQAQQQAQYNRQNDLAITIAKKLTDSSDPQARMAGWQNIKQLAGPLGVKIPDDVIQSLGRGDLDPKTLQDAVLARQAGVEPDMLLKIYKGLTPQHIPFLDKLVSSPDYMRKLGIDPEEVQQRREEFQLRKRAADLAQQKADLAERRQEALETRQISSEERASRNEARADRRLDLMEKGLTQKVGTKEEKAKQTFAVMSDALDNMTDLAARLDAKGYLPKTAAGPVGGLLKGDMSSAKARMNQEMFPNDPDWVQWKQLQASLVGFDRTVLNDIGARAFQAFKNQFAFFDNPPTRESIDQTVKQMRGFLDTAQKGKGEPTVERITIKVGGNYYTKDWRRGEPLPPGAEIVKVD